MSDRIAWIDTEVKISKSIGEIYEYFERLPNCLSCGVLKPSDPLGKIQCTFIIVINLKEIRCNYEVDPKKLLERILEVYPYTSRTRGTKFEYEKKMKAKAPKIAYRQLSSCIKGIVEILASDAVNPSQLLLGAMQKSNGSTLSNIFDQYVSNPDRLLSEKSD